MYLDKEESNKVKSIDLKKSKLYNISKGIAITLIFTTILTSCSKLAINKDEEITDINTNYQQMYIDDKFYNELCDNGYLLIDGNIDGKYYSYKIKHLLLHSKNKNKLNEEYYLTNTPTKNKNIITNEEGPDYRNSVINIFKQSSIMYKIFTENQDKISFKNNQYYIKLSEKEFKNYVQNWDGIIYNNEENKKIENSKTK